MNQGGDIDGMNGAGGNAAKWFGYCNGESRSSSSACDQGQWTVPDEADNGLTHSPGMLAMAKTSNPNTGGSQFYLNHRPTTWLNNRHTVFGRVLEGRDVACKLRKDDRIDDIVVVRLRN